MGISPTLDSFTDGQLSEWLKNLELGVYSTTDAKLQKEQTKRWIKEELHKRASKLVLDEVVGCVENLVFDIKNDTVIVEQDPEVAMVIKSNKRKI